MNLTQFYFDIEDKINGLKKEIEELKEYKKELENRMMYTNRQMYDTLYNLTNENFSTVSLSADQYVRVGGGDYKAGIEGANSDSGIVFWAGGNSPSLNCPYYVLADGRFHFGSSGDNYITWNGELLDVKGKIQADTGYISSGLVIGSGGSYTVGDLSTQEYALGLADDAYYDAIDYTDNYADGTYLMNGARLKSTDGNLLLNYGDYYLYAANDYGQGFYVDKEGDALFTGDITGSKFYGTGINSAYIEIGVGYSSNLADFKIARGGASYPKFKIYDALTSVELHAGALNDDPPIRFLNTTGATTYPRGTWDFNSCTVENLYAKYA